MRASVPGHGEQPVPTPPTEWYRLAWYLRWVAYLYVLFWVLPLSGEATGALSAVLAIASLVNALGATALGPTARRPTAACLVTFDFVTVALALALGRAANQPTILLFALPILEASMAYAWLGAVGVYSSAVIFAVAAHWSLLRTGDGSDGPVPVLILLGLVAAGIGQLAHTAAVEARMTAALRLTFGALHQLEDMHGALALMVTAAADLVQAERVFLLLPSEDRSELVAYDKAAGVDPATLERTRVPWGRGIAYRVFETGQSYLCADARRDRLANPDMVRLHNARAVAVAPMRAEGRSVGVLVAVNHRAGAHFGAQDAQHLEMLAAQIAVVIEHQSLHRRLQAERSTLNAILHSISSAVLVTDAQGRVGLLNAAAEQLLTTVEAMAVGQPLASLEVDAQVVEVLALAQRTGQPVTEEVTLTTPGNLIARVDCCPVRSDSGSLLGYVAVFNDITELRRLDLMKRDFISSVSHELRTPLTSVKAYTATLLRAEFDRETQLEFLNVINEQCDRLTRLITDLLAISKIESGTPLEVRWAKVELQRLLEKVVRLHQGTTAHHRIETSIGDEIIELDGEEDKLERVLANLLNNAIKYTPNGGRIAVGAEQKGSELWLTVADEGIGIAPDQTRIVFQKFYQVDSSHTRRAGGSGLGLFLVKHLVEAHGGEIWVESELGRGSCFTCRIPVHRGGLLSPRRLSGSVFARA